MRTAPWDFPGGIAVPEDKAHRDAAPRELPLPHRLRLPLESRGRTLALAIARGAHVLRGTVVATDAHGTPLHAPTSGRIVGTEHDGAPWLVLECDGRDAAAEAAAHGAARSFEDFVAAVRDAGIVGMGGGGYPLHRKLVQARAAGVHTLVVNAVECEPGLTADETLLRTRPHRVGEAIDAICTALGGIRAVVAIDPRKRAAIAALEAARPDLDLVAVPARYPAGAERALVTMLTHARLGRSERPVARGLVIVNVATLDAVGEWLATGAPVTRRLVAVCGPALRSQGTAWVRIGHVVRDVIAAFGVDAAHASRLTLRDGGVVSGRTVQPDAGIARTTLGLHATTASAPDALPCIRCGRCAEVCPERLAPQILHSHATEQRLRGLVDAGLDACIECGACDLVCPSRIPLLTEFRAGKRAVLAQRTAEALADTARRRVEAHEQRAKETAASAEARRRARLAARLGPPQP